MVDQFDDVDFAIAAFREEGAWTVQELTRHHLVDVETLGRRAAPAAGRLRCRRDGRDGRGLLLVVRVAGPATRVLLSDVTAADEWDLAASAVDFLGLPQPEDEDEQVPAGDLELLADLGMHPMDLGVLLDDFDLYPDEMLSDIARRVGFGELLRRRRGSRPRPEPPEGERTPYAGPVPPRPLGASRCSPHSPRREQRSRPTTYRSAPSSSASDGDLLGTGRNVREADADPTGHAEVVAPAGRRPGTGRVAAWTAAPWW